MMRSLICLSAVGLILAIAGGAGAQELSGQVAFEYWFGGGVDSNLDNLKAAADFPDTPHGGVLQPALDHPDMANVDYWGARGRAFLTPPADGDYTFWLASDDDSELWLSTDEDPANAVMVANLEGWCNYQDYAGTSGSRGDNAISAPVSLVAGQRYYVEFLFSDGTGGGHGSVAWSGAEMGDDPVTIAGDYLATSLAWVPQAVLQAKNPDPADGAVDITSPLMTWEAGALGIMHDLYFGITEELGEADFVGRQPMGLYFHAAGFEPGTTYYWRVDDVDAAGNVYTGKVWSFTAMPLEAHVPSPYDGALWRKLDTTFSWTAGLNATSHKLYGGTDEAAVAAADESAFLGEQAETSASVGELEPNTRYYWRIDEVDSAGTVTPGPVWTFTTIDPAGGAVAQYWDNMSLSGDAAIVTVVPEVNFDWGSGGEPGINSPDPCIPVDGYSCRWTAALNVPVTGTYKLYDASDDGGRLFLNGEQIAGNWVDRGTTEDASADLELEAGGRYLLVMEQYENGGGASAYLRWSGPGIPKEIIPQGALMLVDWATNPVPANGAEGLGDMPVMTWLPGDGAVEHDVFLSANKGAVTAGDAGALQARVAETAFIPAEALNWNTTYYWKVDEVAEDGTIIPGDVWSFAVADYIPVIDDAVTINWDNTVDPNVTEYVKTLDTPDAPQDWTKNGVSSLQLETKGSFKFMEMNGSYTLFGAGKDIWDNADEFRYAYKSLTGDGTMVARVAGRGSGSNEWAKGGVMIRETLDAGSTHAFMPITAGGGNGASFQRRLETDGGSSNSDSGSAVDVPYLVKIERTGSSFAGSISADGETWTALGDPVTIEMVDPVYIGLAVTSHASGELRYFEFDNVEATGDVTGDWAVADIGVAQGGNDPAPLYVALEDSAGNTAVVNHPANPDLVVNADWTMWKVALSKFGGVNLSEIASVIVGIGDGQLGGAGSEQIDNMRVVKGFPVEVENASFELPGTPEWVRNFRDNQVVVAFEKVPGWSTDKYTAKCGVEKAEASDGKWSAYLWGGQSPIWQVTDHTIVEGEIFQVSVDAAMTAGAIRDKVKSLKVVLFYDNDGTRVPVASTTGVCVDTRKTYSLTFKADSARDAVGHKIGVEFSNIGSANLVSIDKVRLNVK